MTWTIWGYPHFRKPPYQAALLSLTSTSRSMFRMKDIFPKTNRNKILLSTTRSFGTLQQCPSWKVFCIQFPKISWKHWTKRAKTGVDRKCDWHIFFGDENQPAGSAGRSCMGAVYLGMVQNCTLNLNDFEIFAYIRYCSLYQKESQSMGQWIRQFWEIPRDLAKILALSESSTQIWPFFPNSKILLWGLWPRLAPVRSVQLQHQVPGKVPEGSGGFRCRYLLRFRRVSVQIAGEVPEGSGADTVLRFRRLPVQIPGEALEGSVQIPGDVSEGFNADSWWGCAGR